jgi:ATP-dependent RNA helicase DeaD
VSSAPPPAPRAAPKRPVEPEVIGAEIARGENLDEESTSRRKSKYERPARTGREPGKVTLFLNVGRKQLITPADIVGKIAGVARLPTDVVGAIDIHQRHSLVDVAAEHGEQIAAKLKGIRVKGVALEPAVARPDGPGS